jgi:hypothetical protein
VVGRLEKDCSVFWILILASIIILLVALYGRLTEPVLPYGERQYRPLFSVRSFLFGSAYGLLFFAWLTGGEVITDAQRQARAEHRARMSHGSDAELQRRAGRLAAAERAILAEDEAARKRAEKEEWQQRRRDAVEQRAVEEMAGFVLAGQTRGPCAILRGCVCGLGSQFSDSRILARRYRRWCRSFRGLEGEWLCRSQLQVVKADLYRNRLVLIEKGLTIPSICPQRQSN